MHEKTVDSININDVDIAHVASRLCGVKILISIFAPMLPNPRISSPNSAPSYKGWSETYRVGRSSANQENIYGHFPFLFLIF